MRVFLLFLLRLSLLVSSAYAFAALQPVLSSSSTVTTSVKTGVNGPTTQQIRRLYSTALYAATSLSFPNESSGTQSSSPTTATSTEPKIGVLLLNLGGPETGDDVEGVLRWVMK